MEIQQQIKKEPKVSPVELLRLEMLSSLQKHTRAMFKAQYKRNFIVNGHHDEMFEALQDVVDGKCTRLIINIPPRYGKTEVVIKSFTSWGFGLNPKSKFLHLSYSDMLVNDNSSVIRQAMSEDLYKAVYPKSALLKEKGSSTRWKTKAGGEFYAVSTQGQVTGFGAGQVDDEELTEEQKAEDAAFEELLGILEDLNISTNVFNGAILIDDPMKPEDAFSDTLRERINKRFESTIRNRTNSRKTPIIIIMQRLHEHDLCGYLMETEPDEWRVVAMPAIQIDDEGNEVPLWEMKHNIDELHHMDEIDPLVFGTQYMQDPKPAEGLMYQSGFRTYTRDMIPTGKKVRRLNYTDTADTGADHLCSISFVDSPEYLYVTDVYYTKKPMEITEPGLAKVIAVNPVDKMLVEGNNGGRGFARAVEKILRFTYKNFKIRVKTFTQTKNKYVRIFTNSAQVQNMVLMPEGWEKKWPQFYSAIMSYRKDNTKKSQHDDAPDCLTGIYEMHNSTVKKKKTKRKN